MGIARTGWARCKSSEAASASMMAQCSIGTGQPSDLPCALAGRPSRQWQQVRWARRGKEGDGSERGRGQSMLGEGDISCHAPISTWGLVIGPTDLLDSSCLAASWLVASLAWLGGTRLGTGSGRVRLATLLCASCANQPTFAPMVNTVRTIIRTELVHLHFPVRLTSTASSMYAISPAGWLCLPPRRQRGRRGQGSAVGP